MTDDQNVTLGEEGDQTAADEADRAGTYEQSGSLGTGTQGDSIARELAERERDDS